MWGNLLTDRRLSLPPVAKSLSARLLFLTLSFVMLAEVLIYAPSIGRFRLVYLEERLAAAHLAILALEATPDQMVSEELERELMAHVGAYSVALTKPDAGKLMLMVDKPGKIDASHDLRRATFMSLIRDSAVALLSARMRILRVVGWSPQNPEVLVEIVIDEMPLRAAMIDYSWRILNLSLVISLFTSALVFFSLHLLMVRPMRRITASMSAFRDNPEDPHSVLPPSQRSDEMGIAQRELAEMQQGLREALLQKTRLAALGTAVTKINHDLRNILTTASVVSDRLGRSEDPEVRSLTPTLVSALDRAVNLCAQTLNFTREGPLALDLTRFDLRALLAEVEGEMPRPDGSCLEWVNRVEPGLEIEADRDQLFRVFLNLSTNATEAGSHRLEIAARRVRDFLVIEVTDNGPGLPKRASQHLFEPFSGSARKGGTGLGLAISRDVMQAHGGDIKLERTDETGTQFLLVLPMSQG